MSPPAAIVVPRLDRTFAQEIASEREVERWIPTSVAGEDLHPSEILRLRSERAWRVGELYDKMLAADLDLSGIVQKRFEAVLALPRWIVPADGSPAARDIAEFCQVALGRISNLALNLQHQLASRTHGIALEEILWERQTRGALAGAWLPVDLIDRPMWRFKFKSGQLYVRRPLGSDETPAPPGKFLVMRYGSKDTPWGRGLLDDVYWHWFLKKNGLKFFAVFLDKWAQPTAVGLYKHNTSTDGAKINEEAQSQLLAAIEAMQSEYGIALPEGLKIELLEATRSGSANYESFLALLNRSMALKFLGEVDTSGQAKGPGSFAKSQVSNQVRLEKVALDAHDLGAHLTDHLLAPLVAVNYGPDAAVPRFTIDTVEADDRQLRQEGIAAVLDQGQPVPKRYFYMTYQVPEPREGEEVVERERPAPPPPPALPEPPEDDDDPEPDPETPDEPAPPGDDDQAAKARAVTYPKLDGGVALAVPLDDPSTEPDPAGELTEIAALAEERAADFDTMATELATGSLDYYAGWSDHLLEAWDDGSIAAGRGLRRLIGRLDPVAHARWLETSQIHGAGLALQQLTEDFGGTAPLLFALPPGWDQARTPTSAIDYWSRLTTMPKEAFNLLGDANRKMAFTVAGVEDASLLLEIHRLLGQAIGEGWVRERFVRELAQLFKSRGLDPLARWHAELVYMNNVRQAASAMRYQQLVLNPAAKRLTPYLTWVSMDDERVRPTHRAMHGYIAAIDHPIWKTWWPPSGHACRCMVEPINLAKARRMGLTGSEPAGPWPQFEGAAAQPDEGFVGAPDLGAVADTMEARALQLGEDAKVGGEDLAEAMRQLLTQLLTPF